MKIPEIDNIDLIDILKEPVEQKNEVSKDSDFFNLNLDEKPTINKSDFEPEQKASSEPDNKTKKPLLTEKQYAEQAELSIALFDGLQTLTLPFLYKKAMFNRKELEDLKTLNQKKKQQEVELTEEDLILEEKYRTYKELSDNVSFNENEIELLKTPLTKVFSKYNVQLGPEFMLFTALAYVSIPRYLPLFSKLEKLDF